MYIICAPQFSIWLNSQLRKKFVINSYHISVNKTNPNDCHCTAKFKSYLILHDYYTNAAKLTTTICGSITNTQLAKLPIPLGYCTASLS